MTNHPLERISAYADGELTEEEERSVEAHLSVCTECSRELALIRALGGAMKASLAGLPEVSVWGRVHRSITTPVGWILLIGGVAVWSLLALVEWFQAGDLSARWLATTAAGVGFVLIGAGIGYEQYCAWRDEPYKHIER
jgi:anti-sigma factor RsiW